MGGYGPFCIGGITVEDKEGSDLAGCVEAVGLYLDDGDGIFDPVNDILLGEGSYDAGETSATVGISPDDALTIEAHSEQHIFVTYRFSAECPSDSTFAVDITEGADFFVNSAGTCTSATFDPAKFPLLGNAIEIRYGASTGTEIIVGAAASDVAIWRSSFSRAVIFAGACRASVMVCLPVPHPTPSLPGPCLGKSPNIWKKKSISTRLQCAIPC